MAMTNVRYDATGVTFSEHATRRLRQRGIGREQLIAFYNTCDRERPVGRGCIAMTLSKRAQSELLADGWPPAEVDSIRRMAIVEAPDGIVVTVCKQHGKRSRMLRRGRK